MGAWSPGSPPVECPLTASFNPATHEYRADGNLLSSATGILRAVGLYSDYSFAEDHHRWRGQAVHTGAALIDFGITPQLAPVPAHLQGVADDIVKGYWPAFRRWKERTKWQGVCWECPLVSADGFAGTFDCVGRFGDSPELTLLDLKSGTLPPMVAVQLAAYDALIRTGVPVDPEHPGWEYVRDAVRSGCPLRRVALRLERTGKDSMHSSTPKGHSYDDRMWEIAWRNSLSLYNLRSNYNLLEKR